MASNIDGEKQLAPAPLSDESLLEAQHRHGEDGLENRGFFRDYREARNRGHLKMKIFRALVIFTTLWLVFEFVGKHVYHKFKKCHFKGSIIKVRRLQSTSLTSPLSYFLFAVSGTSISDHGVSFTPGHPR
jgi:hypothetical protein